MLSARSTMIRLAARAIALQIGIVAFFIKPFNDEKFLGAVHDALNLAKRW